MTSDELRNYATVVAALVGLLVFIGNSSANRRNRRIENVARFIECHDRLFSKHGFLGRNIIAIETKTLRRDVSDLNMEAGFHLMLLEIERLAILANNGAVPRLTQVYMFGGYARHIGQMLTEQERSNMFWELAVAYLDSLAADTDRYEALTPGEREKFWR